MRAGSVAPKNHVRLKVFRIISKTYKPIEASTKDGFSIRPLTGDPTIDLTEWFLSLSVRTRPKYQIIELEDRFELPLISAFNVLRERIANFIEFRVPAGYQRDVKPAEFIRLYAIEDNQPVSIVHEPLLTTLK